MVYEGIIKRKSLYIKVAAIVVAALTVFYALRRGQWIYLPLTALVVLAVFFDKRHLITEDGVDIAFYLFGVPSHNVWKWDEIDTLHADWTKSDAGVMLHIGKDINVRTFVMPYEDLDDILKLAKEKNPSIYIENLTREEAERRAVARERMKEAERAQRAARRKKRK